MNFQDLLTKMKQLDEAGSAAECDTSSPNDAVLIGEKNVDECGMPGMDNMPHGMMGAPKQSDSVTMNVSMNGSGAGGIRDLMSILKNIEQGEHSAPAHDADADDILVGVEEEQGDGGFQTATTNPAPETADIDAVTPTGNDMHSQGGEAEKVNGGGNPMGVDESLVARLAQHYQAIKEGEKKAEKKEKEPEGTYSSKRHETDGQRIARLAREKRLERMKAMHDQEMER